MQNKWFTSWRGQETSTGPTNGEPKPAGEINTQVPADNGAALKQFSAHGFAASGLELLGFDEIYHSAGIKGPRLGYTIGKVIEMLHSEHIKALPPEMKRSSLLMALEAAGVQVDEVLQDATLRQRSITSYEAIQRKHLEEYEARKAQENCAIQAEAERVAAEYAARIAGNLDEVAREKESFRKWQSKKQQEAQAIADAVALCVTQSISTSPKPVIDSMAAFRELANATNDPAFVNRG
jgi:hypothetical protein